MGILERTTAYDVENVRRDFPILSRQVFGRPLVYLDNAASAQKPRQVLDAERHFCEEEYANVHRGIYWLSDRATQRFDQARETVRRFLGARHAHEVIFTRNATEAINLVAASWGRKFLKEGDEIIITELEHHANIVPWQMLREEKGLKLHVVPIDDDGAIILEAYEKLLSPRTRLVSFAHMSNVLGTILPVEDMVRMAKNVGAKVLIDGAQAVTHIPVDVQALDCDFYVFSSHKLYGPSGIGVLWGREEVLNAMPPYQGGGDMILTVTFERTTFAPLPAKFEAGTPAISQAVGLAAAIDYVSSIGLERIGAYENELLNYAAGRLREVPGLRLIGTAPNKASVLSFAMSEAHPHDIATVLDRQGIAIRAGHHCAQPLMDRLDVPATARASFALYNTRAEADALVDALLKVEAMFRR